MNIIAETAATEQLRKRENIECASLGCRVRKIFHRIHEAERRGSIALVEIAATIAPAQPPTSDNTDTYCLLSGPRQVVGCQIIPDDVLNCQRGAPVLASTALNQPSIVP